MTPDELILRHPPIFGSIDQFCLYQLKYKSHLHHEEHEKHEEIGMLQKPEKRIDTSHGTKNENECEYENENEYKTNVEHRTSNIE